MAILISPTALEIATRLEFEQRTAREHARRDIALAPPASKAINCDGMCNVRS